MNYANEPILTPSAAAPLRGIGLAMLLSSLFWLGMARSLGIF